MTRACLLASRRLAPEAHPYCNHVLCWPEVLAAATLFTARPPAQRGFRRPVEGGGGGGEGDEEGGKRREERGADAEKRDGKFG